MMKKTTATAFAALAFGLAALAPATPASADAGAAVAAGIGGFALGAIAGGALAQPAPQPPVYYGGPAYAPVYGRCWRERRPVFDEYGDVIGFRRQRVCE
jgi:hypothetical protein